MKTNTLTIDGWNVSPIHSLQEHGDRTAPDLGFAANPKTNPWNTTVFELFSEIVHRAPNSIALADGQQSLTYAQLWNFADAFRARLVGQGVKPGDMVAISASRSLATVAAILGIVMAGGCYVPIDIEEYPVSALSRIAGLEGLRHWIADAKAREKNCPVLWAGRGDLPKDAAPCSLVSYCCNPLSCWCSVLSLEEVSCPVGNDLAEIPRSAINGDSALYVMFTSGSTGAPKGVVVPNRAVVRLVSSQEFITFDSTQTFLLHSPLCFDASTLEFWGSLLHGSRLVVAPGRSLGLDDYTNLILQQGVTTLWLTAAMFHLAAEHTPEMFAPLRQLVFGGDVISPRHVERMRALYPALHMVNGYGPTENTTFTCCYPVPREYRAEGTLPIGSPIAYTTVHILDTNHKALPAGQPGELAAGGAGVALGYLGRPEATAERFIPDTFSTRPGALLYLTGDRAVQRPDGTIEFLGRMDRQVKIAGHRVELAAVENALSASPLVTDAAVVVFTVPSGEKHLVACVALANPVQNAETTLRGWLQARLSRTSIPQDWLFLEKLPINGNGKLDRSGLQTLCEMRLMGSPLDPPTPALAQQNKAIAESKVAADGNNIMAHLQKMWATLLGRAAVGADENFFDLGGTSLLLIEMHARLHAEFASTPSLVDMFAFPTSRSLAARLGACQQKRAETGAGELRGQRQRAAMLARRPGMRVSKTPALSVAREDGSL